MRPDDIRVARYFNVNGFAGAIIAVIKFNPDDTMRDWSAYWGGCDLTMHKDDAVKWVAQNGDKISLSDAQYYFPDIPPARYRR